MKGFSRQIQEKHFKIPKRPKNLPIVGQFFFCHLYSEHEKIAIINMEQMRSKKNKQIVLGFVWELAYIFSLATVLTVCICEYYKYT